MSVSECVVIVLCALLNALASYYKQLIPYMPRNIIKICKKKTFITKHKIKIINYFREIKYDFDCNYAVSTYLNEIKQRIFSLYLDFSYLMPSTVL